MPSCLVKNLSSPQKFFTALLFAVAVTILFFHSVIFSDQTFYFRDIHRFFFPMKYHLAQSLAQGHIPFWNPHIFCGAPFLSAIQSGVFYPIALTSFLLPFPSAFDIYVLSHFIIGFIFFYLFIRVNGHSSSAALLTGISFCFGGYTISSINVLNNLASLIWLPAILWAYHESIFKKSLSKLFLTLTFISLSVLGGEPQLVIINVVILFLYGLLILPFSQLDAYSIFKRIAGLFLVVLGVVGLTMVQLGPTYLDYDNSVRIGGLSYLQASKYSIDWPMLKHLFWPLPFDSSFSTDPAVNSDFFPGKNGIPWLLTVYPGVVIAPLASLKVIFSHSKKALLWGAIFLVSITLSLGDNTPFFRLFYQIFPFFRYPSKFIFPAGFSILVLSASGFDLLFSYFRRNKFYSTSLSFFFLFILTADLYLAHGHLNPTCSYKFYKYRHPDLNPIFSDSGNFRIFVDSDSFDGHLPHSIFDTHLRWQTAIMPNTGILHNLNHIGGEAGLELNYQYIITEMLTKSWEEKLLFLRQANVKYIVSAIPLQTLPELQGHIHKLSPILYRLTDNMARAWIVGRLQSVKGDIIQILSTTKIDPTTSALAPPTDATHFTEPFSESISRIQYLGTNRISINASVSRPSILVLSEAYYPGWRAFINGKEKEIIRLNLLFQGVALEKGSHNVEFIFRPYGFFVFSSISILTCVFIILLWLFSFKKFTHKKLHHSHWR